MSRVEHALGTQADHSTSTDSADWLVSFCDPSKGGELQALGFSRQIVADKTPQSRALYIRSSPERSRPQLAAADNLSVIFEGVIYNRGELLKTISGRGLTVEDDAGIILEGYRIWGEELLGQLKGIFALLIRDISRDVLLCARDHLGIYPLFFSETGSELLVSTSIQALVRHPRVSNAISRVALANYLTNRVPESDETFYEHVKRVPPGHVLRVTSNERRLRRYWSMAVPGAGATPATREELEQFDDLFERAVNRCTELGPTGIFLSGGLDSVSIAAYAADSCLRDGRPKPWALSLAFPGPCDEAPVQRGVADALGLPQLLLPLDDAVGSEGQLLSALKLSSQLSAPLLHFWLPAYTRLGEEARVRGCRVIMTGAGGDDWLGVGPSYCADLLRVGNIGGLVQLFRTYRRSFGTTPTGFLRVLWGFGARPLIRSTVSKLGRSIAPWLLDIRRRRRFERPRQILPDWLAPDPDLRRELNEHSKQRTLNALQDSRPEPSGLYWKRTREYLDMPSLVMLKEENFESFRRVGLQEHMPFWDLDLINLLGRIPPELLNDGGLSKGMVRHKLAQKFPNLGFERQKKLWASNYFDAVMEKEIGKALKVTDGISALSALGIVDSKRIQSRIDTILAGGQAQTEFYGLWLLLNAEAWTRPRS